MLPATRAALIEVAGRELRRAGANAAAPSDAARHSAARQRIAPLSDVAAIISNSSVECSEVCRRRAPRKMQACRDAAAQADPN